MTAPAQIDLLLGSDVSCTDGAGGVLRRVVVDPSTRRATHLVVAPQHRPDGSHLVPLDRISTVDTRIHLRCTLQELSRLEEAEDTYRLAAARPGSDDQPPWPYDGRGAGGTGMGVGLDVLDVPRGAALVVEDHIPTGEVQVHGHEEVLGADGVVGRLLGLSVTVADSEVTQLLLGVGHRWHEQHTAVPISAVLTLDAEVTVSLSRADVASLTRSEGTAGPHPQAAAPGTIVVGVDDSEAAQAALALALLEAAVSGRQVHAVRVWPAAVWLGEAPGAYPFVASSEAGRHTAQQLLKAAVDGQPQRQGLRADQVTTQVHEGEPGRRLVQLSQDAGLVVVGGRHRGPLASALLGSATNYVLQHAFCPVMVVPATDTPVNRIGRVLVGVDGSASSRAALRWGLAAAERHGCVLVAAYAYLDAPAGARIGQSPPGTEEGGRAWLHRELAEIAPAAGVDVRAELLASPPARGLLENVDPDDIVVVGRGHGGFTDRILGSVAVHCAQHALGPVVVVPADREG